MMARLAMFAAGLMTCCAPLQGAQSSILEVPRTWHSPCCAGFVLEGGCLSWWEALNDPVLDWLIDRLSDQNLDIAQARNAPLHDYQAIWSDIATDVARSYIELRTLQMKRCLLEKNIDSQKDTFRLTESLLDSGFAGSIDAMQAEAQIDLLAAQLPKVNEAILKAVHHLSVSLGYAPAGLYGLLCAPASLPCLPAVKPILSPCEVVQRRPDVKKILCESRSACEKQKKIYAAIEDVENALAAYCYEEKRLQELTKALGKYEQSYKTTLELYEKGLKSYLDVQNAFRAYLSVEDSLLQSRSDLLFSYILIYKALGGGW